MSDAQAPAPFVVGVSRSGTTLLRLMLDAHSDLAIPSETHFLPRLRRGRFRRISRDAFLDAVTTLETWPNLVVDEADFRDAVRALDRFTVSDGVRCFYQLYAARFGKSRWGDKTPPYSAQMDFIGRLLPEAHFLHVIRDGRDVAVSMRGLWWGPGDEPDDQARFWAQRIERARSLSSKVRHYSEVRYEALVRDPEGTLRAVCDFLALPFEQGMLAYHDTASERLAEYRQPFGLSGHPTDIAPFIAIHERVTHPPDPGRIGRWRTEMTQDERRRYEEIAGPLLRELGYEMSS